MDTKELKDRIAKQKEIIDNHKPGGHDHDQSSHGKKAVAPVFKKHHPEYPDDYVPDAEFYRSWIRGRKADGMTLYVSPNPDVAIAPDRIAQARQHTKDSQEIIQEFRRLYPNDRALRYPEFGG